MFQELNKRDFNLRKVIVAGYIVNSQQKNSDLIKGSDIMIFTNMYLEAVGLLFSVPDRSRHRELLPHTVLVHGSEGSANNR